MQLSSSVFSNNGDIPAKYTCDGKDISPPLAWNEVPYGTQSFVLILDDPDAPMGTWIHWVLYNIPMDVTSLLEDAEDLPFGTEVGINSWDRLKYGGPCPPSGQHRYVFELYALDRVLELLPKETSAEELRKIIETHVLDKTQLIGLYKR